MYQFISNGLVALFTGILTLATILLWWETRRLAQGADDQSTKMQASIAEAAKAAIAMQSVAESLKINADQIVKSVTTSKEISIRQQIFGEMQMRAYLTVLIGSATYQERPKGLRFQCNPVLLNTGHTPAKNIRYRGKVAAMTAPLPSDFKFSLPKDREGRALLGPHQNGAMNFLLEDYVPDEQVEYIKHTNKMGLYVWGVVSYDDTFGKRHKTTFAQQIYWVGSGENEIVKGWHLSRHGRAT